MSQRIEMEWGYVEFGNPNYRNEVIIVTTATDPPMVRMASPTRGNFGGMCWSWLRPDGRHETLGILQGKLDERFRNDPAALAGEATLHLRRPHADNDAAQVCVLTVRSDGVAFHVPVSGAGGGASPVAGRFYSGTGRYVWNCQDDGHMVQYDTWDATGKPYATEAEWQAVWSSWRGLLRELPWT